LTYGKISTNNGFIPRQKWFVEKILSSLRGLILDCGCGRGLWSKKLKERGVDVVSLDLSRDRLKMCKDEGNNDEVIRASCVQLPFKSNCFNSVLFLELIEHLNLKDQDKALSETNRILKSSGRIVITSPNKPIYCLLTKFLHVFEYNPEHIHELSLSEIKNLVRKYFTITLVDGKIGGPIDFLDKLCPALLCWDIVLIGKRS